MAQPLIDWPVIFGALPNFWQGMMLIMIFSVWLGWLPSRRNWKYAKGEAGLSPVFLTS